MNAYVSAEILTRTQQLADQRGGPSVDHVPQKVHFEDRPRPRNSEQAAAPDEGDSETFIDGAGIQPGGAIDFGKRCQ
jgi:hypothetical protein